MLKLARILLPAALAAALVAPAALAQSSATPPTSESKAVKSSYLNVRVSVRLGSIEGGKRVAKKSYDLIVANGTRGSQLLSGHRVPLPNPGDESAGDFIYQNIGFTTHAKASILNETQIMVSAEIENSVLIENPDGRPPKVQTRQLSVDAVLTDGVPLELTRAENVTAENEAGFVEIEARILRPKTK